MANCQRRRRCCSSIQTEQQAIPVQVVEDMPMNHYVNAIPVRAGDGECCCELRELNEILDHQNEILAEILQELRTLGDKSGT